MAGIRYNLFTATGETRSGAPVRQAVDLPKKIKARGQEASCNEPIDLTNAGAIFGSPTPNPFAPPQPGLNHRLSGEAVYRSQESSFNCRVAKSASGREGDSSDGLALGCLEGQRYEILCCTAEIPPPEFKDCRYSGSVTWRVRKYPVPSLVLHRSLDDPG